MSTPVSSPVSCQALFLPAPPGGAGRLPTALRDLLPLPHCPAAQGAGGSAGRKGPTHGPPLLTLRTNSDSLWHTQVGAYSHLHRYSRAYSPGPTSMVHTRCAPLQTLVHTQGTGSLCFAPRGGGHIHSVVCSRWCILHFLCCTLAGVHTQRSTPPEHGLVCPLTAMHTGGCFLTVHWLMHRPHSLLAEMLAARSIPGRGFRIFHVGQWRSVLPPRPPDVGFIPTPFS